MCRLCLLSIFWRLLCSAMNRPVVKSVTAHLIPEKSTSLVKMCNFRLDPNAVIVIRGVTSSLKQTILRKCTNAVIVTDTHRPSAPAEKTLCGMLFADYSFLFLPGFMAFFGITGLGFIFPAVGCSGEAASVFGVFAPPANNAVKAAKSFSAETVSCLAVSAT